MFYLYDQGKLNPLPLSPDEVIGIATFCDGILVTNRIDEAILIAAYPRSALLLYPKNLKTIFDYWKLQFRHRTLEEFRIILYAAPKSFLYYFLKAFAWSSMGSYKLIDFGKNRR
ncbi:MAG: hypothetical protein PHW64_03410 [Sulfuricurvum sp.]|nr:hypothetical protein [Sulfuricurvum sp.]